MRTSILFASIVLLYCNTLTAIAANHNSFPLEKVNSHYIFETKINDKVSAKFLLESGIHVMLIDSLFAFDNKNDINLDFIPVQKNENMNLGGKVYKITHKAKGTILLGNHSEYNGEIFVLSNYKSYYDIAIPIQNISNINDSSHIIKLDIEKQKLDNLSRKAFAPASNKYSTTTIHYNSYLNMPTIRTNLTFSENGQQYSLTGNFVLDLGNASFLFLMKQSPVIQEFLKKNTKIKIHNAYNKKGILVAEAIIAEQVNLCHVNFDKQNIAITTALPKFTAEGCIGLKFFEGSVFVFDFDKNILYIKRTIIAP